MRYTFYFQAVFHFSNFKLLEIEILHVTLLNLKLINILTIFFRK
ncbi:hypothetical protein BACCOPRO_01889 [Phocaeicola coprophilus DSM 18228 = JCM 13818]|uniref:Uncharacterized protein n=1 Tax=Phocaeicola coprophilus DSM 18228 = JCM 13818 TaxID=547042 RepID=S0F7N7_9BACT|nr:hypothetical protein BACCOPRO_01889 [Phocaeicola coprophilus DSM 18228 = JCM 13818]